MENRMITSDRVKAFHRYLQVEEREQSTIEKYLRDIRTFAAWADGREISKGLSTA